MNRIISVLLEVWACGIVQFILRHGLIPSVFHEDFCFTNKCAGLLGCMHETIFAFATPEGRSAVAVLRMSGSSVRRIVEVMAGRTPEPGVASLLKLRDPKSRVLIDEAIVLWRPGPRSFTGEDCAEFHVHGSRAVRRALTMALAGFEECRLAEAGEFTRRAFENGKTDLVRLEGLADLLEADTEAQRRQALSQLTGRAGRRFESWRETLLTAMSLLEATVDFSDEDDTPDDVLTEVGQMIRRLREDLRRELDSAKAGEVARNGYKVVIAGPPNVGKSSLLNALSRRDVAIVTEHAGTTRDVLEISLDIGGVLIRIFDTAGFRETSDPVELIGIEKASNACRDADLVMWLSAGAQKDSIVATNFGPATETINVLTKADLFDYGFGPNDHAFVVSAKTGLGLPRLLDFLGSKAIESIGSGDGAIVSNVRQASYISACAGSLDRTIDALEKAQVEIVCEYLRAASDDLSRLIGKIDVEDILGSIFSRFCIGK